MIRLIILRNGIGVLLGLSTLTSCGTYQETSGLTYEVIDQTGKYKKKTPMMLKIAEKATGMTFKGEKIVYLNPLNDIGSITKLEAEMRENDEVEATIAWTAYSKDDKTAFIQPVMMDPPRWAIEHELGHVVLMSNGIGGHPSRYNDKFKYWRN